jgi:DNA-binding SARP family transcriptional activator
MLGPVAVAAPGCSSVLTGKVAELLARLAVAGGAPLSRARLLDDVWPGGSGHPGPLRVAVNRARIVFGQGVVVTVGSSYRIGPHTSDVTRAEQHLGAARDRAQPLDVRVAAYERCLAEWSLPGLGATAGPFLEGLDDRRWVVAERLRLAELHEVAVDERIEALIELGEHQRVLSELVAAAWAAPTREHRAWLLAVALYRSGRQADALSTISAWGRRLRGEFGLEPGPALRDLEQRILHHDPALELGLDQVRPVAGRAAWSGEAGSGAVTGSTGSGARPAGVQCGCGR